MPVPELLRRPPPPPQEESDIVPGTMVLHLSAPRGPTPPTKETKHVAQWLPLGCRAEGCHAPAGEISCRGYCRQCAALRGKLAVASNPSTKPSLPHASSMYAGYDPPDCLNFSEESFEAELQAKNAKVDGQREDYKAAFRTLVSLDGEHLDQWPWTQFPASMGAHARRGLLTLSRVAEMFGLLCFDDSGEPSQSQTISLVQRWLRAPEGFAVARAAYDGWKLDAHCWQKSAMRDQAQAIFDTIEGKAVGSPGPVAVQRWRWLSPATVNDKRVPLYDIALHFGLLGYDDSGMPSYPQTQVKVQAWLNDAAGYRAEYSRFLQAVGRYSEPYIYDPPCDFD